MRVAIVGCGYVADYYMQSLPLYKALELVAATDRDAGRAAAFVACHGLSCLRASLEEVLADPGIELVLNLTDPASHYEVSKACLEAGKHVYSEMPLAMQMSDAQALVELAESKGLQIASAPCSILGETAQSLWKALREQRVGPVKLAYAEMDYGFMHLMPYRKWYSKSGRQWPYEHEFEAGCTVEHAGYYVNWLTAFFGPALSVTAFSSCLYPDKGTDVPLAGAGPDFSVASIRFVSGAVARLTCSNIAPADQHLRLFGDRGILQVQFALDYKAPVFIRRMFNIRRKMIISPWRQKVRLAAMPDALPLPRKATNRMEFCRGPAEMAIALREHRRSALPADYCLHNNEIVLAIQRAAQRSDTYRMTTSFAPLEPRPWSA
jgi:predicted dehydrogenase